MCDDEISWLGNAHDKSEAFLLHQGTNPFLAAAVIEIEPMRAFCEMCEDFSKPGKRGRNHEEREDEADNRVSASCYEPDLEHPSSVPLQTSQRYPLVMNSINWECMTESYPEE